MFLFIIFFFLWSCSWKIYYWILLRGQSRSRVWIRSSESAHMFAIVFFLLFRESDRRTKTFNGRYAAGRNRCRYASERIFCRFYLFEFTVPGRSKSLRILRGILNAFLLTVDPSVTLKKLARKFNLYFLLLVLGYKFVITFVTSLQLCKKNIF